MPAPGLDEIERAQRSIASDPVGFVAAAFFLLFLVVLFMLLRSRDRHLADLERVRAKYAEDLAELNAQHGERLAAVNRERLELAVRTEATLARFLAVVESLTPRARAGAKKPTRRRVPEGDTVEVRAPVRGAPDADAEPE